jgi:hypothetical protein
MDHIVMGLDADVSSHIIIPICSHISVFLDRHIIIISHVSNHIISFLGLVVMFIFITNIGPGLGCEGSKLFYDGLETSRIVSICDDFVKPSRRSICYAQSMMLSEIITNASDGFSMICDKI